MYCRKKIKVNKIKTLYKNYKKKYQQISLRGMAEAALMAICLMSTCEVAINVLYVHVIIRGSFHK